MKVHFIAIGGSAMHNLAIALKLKGYDVTGSDDEIFEPSLTRLKRYNLLPPSGGWHPDRIHAGLDAVILGMHARKDNLELVKAEELKLKIYSYPEYLYEQSKDKIRVVIAGSHGKTTITSMILHVLQHSGLDADYMVGAQLEGFEVMVKLSETARYMVLEGDEYLSSPLDPRPKFHLYRPNIALLSGIAWDHMNVFPTFENYVSQFEKFLDLIADQGTLIYCHSDREASVLAKSVRGDVRVVPYGDLDYATREGKAFLLLKEKEIPLQVFGRHNIQNVHGAWLVCKTMGITDGQFLDAIQTFRGASKRLQLLAESEMSSVYKDFAHSPSKLRATVQALKELHPGRKLVACLELHTYSSLNKDFLPQYQGCMDQADVPIVYFSHHALALKRLPELSPDEVRAAFGDNRLVIFNDPEMLEEYLLGMDLRHGNLLLMSSGNFDGLNLEEIAGKVIKT
jgi:UDP-N-acetylmuramate: L-alanyl-gamma-D-glutamyl-meso-diaminopimelate ligase